MLDTESKAHQLSLSAAALCRALLAAAAGPGANRVGQYPGLGGGGGPGWKHRIGA